MKVTLVYPRLNQASFGSGSIHMPLGVIYLASYLRQNGIDVNIVDCTFLRTWDEYIERMEESNPDIIGFSFSSPMAGLAFEAIDIAKRVLPKALIVAGGPHPTVDSGNTIKNNNIDVVVIGEGEEILLELCRTYASASRDFSKIGRVFFKEDNGYVKRAEVDTPFSLSLDKFPLPERDLIDIDKYISVSGRVTMITSRGCPGRCNFCQPTIRSLFGTKIRSHSSEYIIRDMMQIKDKYYNDNFLVEIVDDTFCFNKSRVLTICDKIVENRLNKIPWWCINRIDFFDEEIAKALKNSGCIGLSLGVESGSDRILNDVMKKEISTDKIRKVFDLCHKYRFMTVAFFMVGNPTETKEDMEMTNSLLRDIHPDVVAISTTTPIIGSELYYSAIKENTLNISDFQDYGYYGTRYPMKLRFLTRDDVQEYKGKLVRTWLINMRKNLIKYIPFCFSLSKLKLVFSILKRSLRIRFNWYRIREV